MFIGLSHTILSPAFMRSRRLKQSTMRFPGATRGGVACAKRAASFDRIGKRVTYTHRRANQITRKTFTNDKVPFVASALAMAE